MTPLRRPNSLMGGGNPIDELDTTMLLARLRAEQGQMNLVAEEAGRIRGLLPVAARGDSLVSAWILLLRLSQVGPDEGPEVQPGSAHEALWRAARLANAGDAAAARESLVLAIERGIADTRLWDDARHLQASLGLAVGPALPLDPPYPPLARVVLRRELEAAVVGQEIGKKAGEAPAAVVAPSSSN